MDILVLMDTVRTSTRVIPTDIEGTDIEGV